MLSRKVNCKSSVHTILSLMLFTVVFSLFYSYPAAAESSWCVRELEKTDAQVVVLHNPDCDLRILPRMYPIKGDDGKVLPMQVQLRSLYAANQTRNVNGTTQRFTVMRGCVSPGKPSPDADAEELAICPNGLMNYFSAPSSDSAAKIVIPQTRELTVAERNLELAHNACGRLQGKPLDSKDIKVADDCKRVFSELVYEGVKASTGSDAEGSQKDAKIISDLRSANSGLNQKLATIAPAAEKARFILPLFFMLAGVAIFGAVATFMALKNGREKRQLMQNNRNLLNERHRSRVQMLTELRKQVCEQARADQQCEMFPALDSIIAKHKARVEKDLKDAWNNLLASQQNKIDSLKLANEALSAQLDDTKALREQVQELTQTNKRLFDAEAALKNELAERDQIIAEMRAESTVIAERNIGLEREARENHDKAREAYRARVEAEERATDLEFQLQGQSERMQKLEADLAQSLARAAVLATSESQQAEKLLFLEERINMLLGKGKRDVDLKRTLPFGAANQGNGTYAIINPEGNDFRSRDWRELTPVYDREELNRRARDSAKPLPMDTLEGLPPLGQTAHFDLDIDPDEEPPYREEMPTMDRPVPVEAIEREQLYHYRSAWVGLSQAFARRLKSDLVVTAHSNVREIENKLTDSLTSLINRAAETEADLNRLRDDQAGYVNKAMVLEEAVKKATAERDSALKVQAELKQALDNLMADAKGNRALEKIYAYQLAAVESSKKASQAELALVREREESAQLNRALSEELNKQRSKYQDLEITMNSNNAVWRKERTTDSGLAPPPDSAVSLRNALRLDSAEWRKSKGVFQGLTNEELLRLVNLIFAAIAERLKRGEPLEYPVASTDDMITLNCVMNVPLMSDYPYAMPDFLRQMAGQGTPRLFHAMHHAFSEKSNADQVPHMLTVRPPAGVPEDVNSERPLSRDVSQVTSRSTLEEMAKTGQGNDSA